MALGYRKIFERQGIADAVGAGSLLGAEFRRSRSCCENGQVLLSSVQFWNFVFFPENDSFHLCFPIMFILLIIFSCGFVNLCCVYCHNPFSFLTLLIFAFSSFLIILIRCLPSLLDFSIDWLLGFCQCSLLFSFSLISAVVVPFR